MSNNATTQYKQTPIGLIPTDWEVKKLGDVIQLSSGKTKPNDLENILNERKIFPVYGGNGIMGFSEQFNSKDEIIIIGRVGEYCGITRYIYEQCWITDNALFTKKFLEEIDVKFLSFKLQYEDLAKLRSKGGQPLISQNPIYIHPISLPKSLPEQQKIATILSTWDAAINTTQQIIAQLQQRNKGLAQQLLTGKMRVKGYEKTKWKYVAINKIAKEISIKNTDDKELIVMSCTKYDGLVPSLEYFGRKIYSDDLSTYKVVKRGQFAYATNHIEEGSIGYQSKFDEALISSMYTVFQTDNTIVDTLFLRLLKSHQYVHQYQRRMEGSIDRRGGLRWDEFSKIKVPIMEIEEQKAIANILDAAKQELQQYQQKLQSLQQQKKGLMQQLLTGKTRVKI